MNLDERFMAEAVTEGKKALPKCAPNPPVGCVIVDRRTDTIIARGHTQAPGQPHAEAMALQTLQALDVPHEFLTLYVTLEPCSFFGRTPSCAKAIAKTGIKTVVVGVLDPHPKNQGAGIEILKETGVNVTVGCFASKVSEAISSHLLGGDAQS